MSENLEQLHNQLIYLSKEHRKTEAKLIDQIQRADECRLYLHRGHASLFRYVCDELGYSEAMTSNLITVARKAREIPQLKEEIRQGNLSVSKLRKVCPVIDEKNQDQWLEAVKTSNTSELEQKVASVKTEHTPRESLRAVAKDTSRLSIDICEKSREKLERLKDLLSSKKNRDCSLQEVLDFALETAIEKHDPIRKAERASERKKKSVVKKTGSKTQPAVCHVTRKPEQMVQSTKSTGISNKPRRKALSKKLVHELQRRDRGRCTYVSADGKRCGAKRFLQFHHILAVARGGKDVLDNIKTLCATHHRLIHQKGSG